MPTLMFEWAILFSTTLQGSALVLSYLMVGTLAEKYIQTRRSSGFRTGGTS